MTNTKKQPEKMEDENPPSSLKNITDEPKEAEKSLLETLGDKKKEAEKLDKASVDLAKESNIEIESDLLTKGEKFLSAIGYISFLCILPLVLKTDSKFCQFHGKQGLVILIFWIVFGFFADLVMPFSYALWLVLRLLYVALACYGIYLGFTGQQKEIPVIGKIAKTLTW